MFTTIVFGWILIAAGIVGVAVDGVGWVRDLNSLSTTEQKRAAKALSVGWWPWLLSIALLVAMILGPALPLSLLCAFAFIASMPIHDARMRRRLRDGRIDTKFSKLVLRPRLLYYTSTALMCFGLVLIGSSLYRPQLPAQIMSRAAWSFAEPAARSAEAMREAVAAYARTLGIEPDVEVLGGEFPLPTIDVEYSYAARQRDGKWLEVSSIVRIKAEGERLTHAEILWKLHGAAREHLADQDKQYFEGLVLKQRHDGDSVPLYEVLLGS